MTITERSTDSAIQVTSAFQMDLDVDMNDPSERLRKAKLAALRAKEAADYEAMINEMDALGYFETSPPSTKANALGEAAKVRSRESTAALLLFELGAMLKRDEVNTLRTSSDPEKKAAFDAYKATEKERFLDQVAEYHFLKMVAAARELKNPRDILQQTPNFASIPQNLGYVVSADAIEEATSLAGGFGPKGANAVIAKLQERYMKKMQAYIAGTSDDHFLAMTNDPGPFALQLAMARDTIEAGAN